MIVRRYQIESLERRWLLAAAIKRLFVGPIYVAPDQLASAAASGPIGVAAADGAVGIPWTGANGIVRSVININAASDANTHAIDPETKSHANRHTIRSAKTIKQDRNALAISQYPMTQSLQPQAPQTTGTTFTGATLTDTGSFPPDTMGAVGPTQYIVAVNGRIRSFNKTTGVADSALNADTDVFFASVWTPTGGGIGLNFTARPRIRYDRMSGRWFVTAIDEPSTNSNNLGDHRNRCMIAVSSGSTISNQASFTFYYFLAGTASTDFLDDATLGIDNNALYIGGNVYRTTTEAFLRTDGYVVRKSSVTGGGPIVVTPFTGMLPDGNTGTEGPWSPQGVDNFDTSATEGYFVGSSNAAFSRLTFRRISTPGATPTISANITLTVPETYFPILVPHLGNTSTPNGQLDALDDRLFNAVIRNGHLWAAHNILVGSDGVGSASGTRDAIRWYDVTNLTSTPSLTQSGTVFDAAASNPRFYWMPSIMVSGQDHVAIGSSTAGLNEHINAATVGRLSTDAPATMQTPLLYTNSTTAYNPSGDPGDPTYGRRWGEYSFTSLDPSDDMTMWTIQEFCQANNSYAVQVAKLLAPPPATPSSTNPSSVAAGASNINVVVTGTSSSGSGFFDPGAGFTNRLAAAVNGGGVTVNSVTYTDPTHITLNLSVASNAAAGLRTITVTNPDGQSVTSASGILTVIGGTGSISGTVYEDRNADGVFNGTDVIKSGVTLTLGGAGSGTTTSDGSGNYTFGSLANGNYTVAETLPSGFIATSSTTLSPTISGGGAVTGQNFFEFPITYIGTSGNDTYTVSSDGTTETILANGITYSIAKTSLSSKVLTFNTAGGDDALAVDYLNGNPVPTSGSISYDGSTQTTGTGDRLIVSGTAGVDATTLVAGTVTMGGSNTTFSNLEGVTVNGIGNADTFAINGETTPTTLSGGDGNDIFTLTTLTAATAALVINGDNNTDSITLDDSALAGNNTYTLTSSTVTRTNGFGGLTYGTAESLNLLAENGNNPINMTSGSVPTTLAGGGGNDTFTLTNLGGITAAVSISGDAQTTSDSIILDDSIVLATDTYTVTGVSVARTGFGGLSFSTTEALTVKCENGTNAINITGDGPATTVFANDGNDILTITPANATALPAALTINGGANVDTIIFDDSAISGTDAYAVTSTTLTRAGFGGLTWSFTEFLNLKAETGNNAINQSSGTFPVTLGGGAGDDTITLTNLTGITGAVTVNGETHASGDAIVLDDSAVAGTDTYTVTSTAVTRTTSFGGLTYGTAQALTLKTQTGNNPVNVNSTLATTPVSVQANGVDTVTVQGTTAGAPVTIAALTGADNVNVNTDNTGTAEVVFAAAQTLGALVIGSGGKANFNGAGSNPLTSLANDGTLIVASGAIVTPGSGVDGAGSATVDGTLNVLRVRQNALTINGTGKVAINSTATGTTPAEEVGSTASTSVIANSLTIAAGGVFDLANNDLIVRNPTASPTLRATIEGLVKGGFGPLSNWAGSGINSSIAAVHAGTGTTALGVVSAADISAVSFAGQTVATNDVLVKYTYQGDANIDGVVNFDDFNKFIAGFNHTSPPRWFTGDFNFSATVDFDDFNKFISGYNTFNLGGGTL